MSIFRCTLICLLVLSLFSCKTKPKVNRILLPTDISEISTEIKRDGLVELQPRVINRLCPTQIGGDRDFYGHGPEVNASALLGISPDSTELFVDCYLHVKETRADWSEAEGSWSKLLYIAPSGYKIDKILTGRKSETTYIDTNILLDRPAIVGDGLVERFEVMGDTRGKDIGNCTDDDVYMNVKLNIIRIQLQRI
jgi:hypothetical protein